jgi:ribosomal protein S18 acetylase RimI-like enzyme
LPDFERFFETRPAPGAYMCWCLYHQPAAQMTGDLLPRSRAEWASRNRARRRKLVKTGRSHGIIVYSKGEPVAWCQFGSWEELPRFDKLAHGRPSPGRTKRFWRITCFTVDRRHRRRGVASTALRAALVAIGKGGGGLVEAYPITRWGAYREYLGTVSMFKKEGFEIVAPFGKSNVVMRRMIRSTAAEV